MEKIFKMLCCVLAVALILTGTCLPTLAANTTTTNSVTLDTNPYVMRMSTDADILKTPLHKGWGIPEGDYTWDQIIEGKPTIPNDSIIVVIAHGSNDEIGNAEPGTIDINAEKFLALIQSNMREKSFPHSIYIDACGKDIAAFAARVRLLAKDNLIWQTTHIYGHCDPISGEVPPPSDSSWVEIFNGRSLDTNPYVMRMSTDADILKTPLHKKWGKPKGDFAWDQISEGSLNIPNNSTIVVIAHGDNKELGNAEPGKVDIDPKAFVHYIQENMASNSQPASIYIDARAKDIADFAANVRLMSKDNLIWQNTRIFSYADPDSDNVPPPGDLNWTEIFANDLPSTQTGISINVQGTGSFTGLSFDVPAHTKGTLEAKIKVMAITSDNVKELNDLVMSMLSASERYKVEEYQKTHASADISFWSILGAGGSASYDDTKNTMHSMGLTDDQISKIIDKIFDIAQNMSHVELDYEIDNSANDYSVYGDLELYTISGEITTSKGTVEYRFLANQGTAGSEPETAPAQGQIIPLQ